LTVVLARTAAHAFVEQLRMSGVKWVFGNPGTTEYAVLDELAEQQDIRFALALHEGVAVSAAAGYARASGQVGVVLLHAGPGLGNGLGMLYNARAAGTPLLVYVGQSDNAALYLEPTLSADLTGMARPIAKWAYEARTANEVPAVIRRAFKVAQTSPSGPVVVSIPMDLMEQPCVSAVEPPNVVRTAVRPDVRAVDEAVALIQSAVSPAIIVGDGVAAAGAIAEVGEFASLIGAAVYGGNMSVFCVPAGHGLWAGVLPADGRAVERVLAGNDLVVCIGTKVLAQIFPDAGPPLGERNVVHVGLDPWELGKSQRSVIVFGSERLALQELILRLRGMPEAVKWSTRCREVAASVAKKMSDARVLDQDGWDSEPMSPARAAAGLADAIPEGAYIVDESVTSVSPLARYLRMKPGLWLGSRGGGIGGGMGMAIGAQLARPDARVIGLVADGSALYALPALWTAAHYKTPVVWVILKNRSYRILKENAVRRREPSRAGLPFLEADLTSPAIDFVAQARGMGVQAERVTDPATIRDALERALGSGVPYLIDLLIDGTPGRP
jgi:benzoylformate decarboxylase